MDNENKDNEENRNENEENTSNKKAITGIAFAIIALIGIALAMRFGGSALGGIAVMFPLYGFLFYVRSKRK